MPLNKLELAVEKTNLAQKEVLSNMSSFELRVQKKIRENLLSGMVGRLYTSIVLDEIDLIVELIEGKKRR